MYQAASRDPKLPGIFPTWPPGRPLGQNLRRILRELEVKMAPADERGGPAVDPDRKRRINEAEGVATLAF